MQFKEVLILLSHCLSLGFPFGLIYKLKNEEQASNKILIFYSFTFIVLFVTILIIEFYVNNRFSILYQSFSSGLIFYGLAQLNKYRNDLSSLINLLIAFFGWQIGFLVSGSAA